MVDQTKIKPYFDTFLDFYPTKKIEEYLTKRKALEAAKNANL